MRNKLKHLRQGSRSICEKRTEFCRLVVKIHDWTEEMKMEYYRNGLSLDLVAKALAQDDSITLVGWVQLACEVENREQTVRMICLNQQMGQPKRSAGDGHGGETSRLHWVPPVPEREWQLQQGLCLKCRANDYFAAKCPRAAPATPKESLRRDMGRPSFGGKLCQIIEGAAAVEFCSNMESTSLEASSTGEGPEPLVPGNGMDLP